MSNFDQNSGIRERLALLSVIGPTVDASRFVYDSRKDVWRAGDSGVKAVVVRTEGSASLDIISKQWNMDRSAAMAFIGYPERSR